MRTFSSVFKQAIKISHRWYFHPHRQVHNLPSSSRVLISGSRDIYQNLALEDWLYENADLQNESFLLLWRDEPCVVIGRHQNPWVECHVPYCEKFNVSIARRKSGGGTVYHDEGNINCSFIADRSRYNRLHNLQLVVDALKAKWSLPLSINDRDDILIYDKYKISGTAAKLARNKSYHHFTLLLNTDKLQLKTVLHTDMQGVHSNATQSVRMSVANLCDHMAELDFHTTVHVIAEHYSHIYKNCTVDHVNPVDENLFPGVCKHYEELISWDWIFGKTPAFSVDRTFTESIDGNQIVLTVAIEIKKGVINNPRINFSKGHSIDNRTLLELHLGLQTVKFDRKSVADALTDVKMKWIAKELYDMNTHRLLDWINLCVMETTGLFYTDQMSCSESPKPGQITGER